LPTSNPSNALSTIQTTMPSTTQPATLTGTLRLRPSVTRLGGPERSETVPRQMDLRSFCATALGVNTGVSRWPS
jgi:hypothetical protein